MPLAYDGMHVVCGGCRAPLRAAIVTRQPITVQPGPYLMVTDGFSHVECENCGSDLGDFDSVEAEFHEAQELGEGLMSQ